MTETIVYTCVTILSQFGWWCVETVLQGRLLSCSLDRL